MRIRSSQDFVTGLLFIVVGIGALVGAGTALLLAPDSGSNTRARIGRKIDELGDAAANAVEAVENHVPGLRGNQMAADRQHH